MINTTMKELKDAIIVLTQTVSLLNERMARDNEI